MTSRGRISSFAAGLTALLLVSGLVVPTIVAAAPAAAPAAASVVAVPPVSVSNNSRQTILIPVAPGLVPSRISGAITAPQSLNGGSLVGGTFANVIDLPSDYTIVYNYAGNNIALIPEPSVALLGALGLLGLLRRRRA